MKILVTGAAGFVGSMLVTKLALNPDFEILALDDCSRNTFGFDVLRRALDNDAFTDRVRLLKTDFTDSEAVPTILDEIGDGAIIHLGGIPDQRLCGEDPMRCVKTNVLGTHVLTGDECKKPRIFIFSSSQAVYGYPEVIPVPEDNFPRPMDLYSVTKTAGEDLVRILYSRNGASVVILRLSFIYGHGLFAKWSDVTGRFVKDAIERGSITLFRPVNLEEHGAQVYDFIHVSDVCNAILSALDFAFKHQSCLEVFNVASGQGLSIAQLAEVVRGLVKDMFGKTVNIERAISDKSEVPRMILDVSKAQKMLGWLPKISVREGIRDLITRYVAPSQST